jgi:hypothetical protein
MTEHRYGNKCVVVINSGLSLHIWVSKQDERCTPIKYMYFPTVLCCFYTSLALDIHILQTQFYFDSQWTVCILSSCIIKQDLFISCLPFFYSEPVFSELINIDLSFMDGCRPLPVF